jgi:hypothetical protein
MSRRQNLKMYPFSYRWNSIVRSGWEGLTEKPWSGSFSVKIQTQNAKVALAAISRQLPSLSNNRIPRLWR